MLLVNLIGFNFGFNLIFATNTGEVYFAHFNSHHIKQCYHKEYQSISISEIKSRFHLYLISIQHWKLVTLWHELFHCAISMLQHQYDVGKRYHIKISVQFQYIIVLHRDENPTKNRDHHNIAYLRLSKISFLTNLIFLLSWIFKCKIFVNPLLNFVSLKLL